MSFFSNTASGNKTTFFGLAPKSPVANSRADSDICGSDFLKNSVFSSTSSAYAFLSSTLSSSKPVSSATTEEQHEKGSSKAPDSSEESPSTGQECNQSKKVESTEPVQVDGSDESIMVCERPSESLERTHGTQPSESIEKHQESKQAPVVRTRSHESITPAVASSQTKRLKTGSSKKPITPELKLLAPPTVLPRQPKPPMPKVSVSGYKEAEDMVAQSKNSSSRLSPVTTHTEVPPVVTTTNDKCVDETTSEMVGEQSSTETPSVRAIGDLEIEYSAMEESFESISDCLHDLDVLLETGNDLLKNTTACMDQSDLQLTKLCHRLYMNDCTESAALRIALAHKKLMVLSTKLDDLNIKSNA